MRTMRQLIEELESSLRAVEHDDESEVIRRIIIDVDSNTLEEMLELNAEDLCEALEVLADDLVEMTDEEWAKSQRVQKSTKELNIMRDVARGFSTKGLLKNAHHPDKKARKVIRKELAARAAGTAQEPPQKKAVPEGYKMVFGKMVKVNPARELMKRKIAVQQKMLKAKKAKRRMGLAGRI